MLRNQNAGNDTSCRYCLFSADPLPHRNEHANTTIRRGHSRFVFLYAAMEPAAANALKQIEEKRYDADLLARGIQAENIRKYGFAFQGKTCLIRKG